MLMSSAGKGTSSNMAAWVTNSERCFIDILQSRFLNVMKFDGKKLKYTPRMIGPKSKLCSFY